MALETIPEAYRHPFNPLDNVDHELVRLYTQGRMMSAAGVRAELQRVYNFNRHVSNNLVERLINYGRFLEPYSDEFDPLDETFGRTRTFNAGLSLALATTANIAFELNVNQFDWRQAWIELPEGIDAPCNVKLEELQTSGDCAAIGTALMEIGQRNLHQLEEPYREMLEELDSEYLSGGLHGNIFKASYGYVFGIGRKVLRDMVYPVAIEDTVRS